MSRLVNAHLHRFGDKVALSLPGNGETKYFSAKEAKALAKHLNACARDIAKVEKFSQSDFKSVEIALANEGNR